MVELKGEEEGGTFLDILEEVNIAIELLHNHLTND
jgi:hypothetical protein